MKRVLSSGLIMMSSLQLAAQSWAPVGASWTYKQVTVAGPDTNLAVIEVVGDTLIQSRSCRRVEMTEGWSMCYTQVRFFHGTSDSLLYWNEDAQEFQLLFIWNALPGQSWSTPVSDGTNQGNPLDTLDWLVLDTGHIVVSGMSLRTYDVLVEPRQAMLYAPIGIVTERLGPDHSPFIWVFAACDAESFSQLRCYSDSTITWQNPDVPQCALGTSVPELNAQAFRVAPTLLDRGEALTVDLGDRLDAEGLTIRLTDLSGRMVREAPIAGTRTTLQVDASGAFLVVLLKNGRPIGRQRVVVR